MQEKNLFQFLAIVKQLGIPKCCMGLSCADFRWNEMIEIISKLETLNLTDDDFKNMSYQESCDTLNKHPVLAARHF